MIERAYLKASNLGQDDEFGRSVAISGDTLVIGVAKEDSGNPADGNDNSATDSGAVYIYRQQSDGTWLEEAYLKASNPGNEDFFGTSIAITGDTLVVGAPGEDSGNPADGSDNTVRNAGAAYVFHRQDNGPWVEEAYLKASNIGVADDFGRSVGISGDTIVVGAGYEDSGSRSDGSDNSVSASGAAYVFRRQSDGTWSEEAYLKASNIGVVDFFGESVAISGEVVVVGARWEDSGNASDGNDNSSSNSGAAYIFRRQGNGTWLEEAYLKPSNLWRYDEFGSSVAVSGDIVAVGVSRKEVLSGRVYLFRQQGDGNWLEEAYLEASNSEMTDYFGFSVALSGDRLIVGAPGEDSSNPADRDDDSEKSSGAAYVFRRQSDNTWLEEAYLKASNPGADDQFGTSVAISGDSVVVGAFGEDSSNPADGRGNLASNSGAAYLYDPRRSGPDLDVTNRDGTPLALGIDFGSILLGTTSPPKKILLRNQGGAPLTGLSASISGTDPSNFTFASVLPDSLAPGECVVLDLQFTPSEERSFRVNLEITSNDPQQGLVEISLNGAGRFPFRLPESIYLKASNPRNLSYFGHSVAVSGDTLVVGARRENSGNPDDQSDISADASGAAYVFRRLSNGTWLQKAYLKASNLGVSDLFGVSVAISGDTLVVGAWGEGSGNADDGSDNSAPASGAAYVFRRQSNGVWLEEAYLKASNLGESDFFGQSVAISGDTVVVGAPGEDSGDFNDGSDNSAPASGAGYVFRRQSNGAWLEEAYLKASNLGADDAFGFSVAVSGDTLVLGAGREDSGNATDASDNSARFSGAAYVFGRRDDGTWIEEAYLKASNLGNWDGFGYSVAISGDTLVVGAPGESSGNPANGSDNSETESGAAYVFQRQSNGTWLEEAYLKASNLGQNDIFGNSVALSGDTLVVGAEAEESGNPADGSDNSLPNSGAAYVFRRGGDGTWIEGAYLKASNLGERDIFGNSVAISGDTVVVGARRESSGKSNDASDNSSLYSGAAYVYPAPLSLSSLPPYFETVMEEAPNLTGADRIPGSAPFNDGVSNLLKYAFNMNLNGPDVTSMTPGGKGGLPLVLLTEEDGERFLQFEFVRLRENGPRYVPEKSSNLEPDSFVPIKGTWTVEPIDAEWERVEVIEPVGSFDSRHFGRVRVLLE
jgi:ketosteroid isomerase-like protein